MAQKDLKNRIGSVKNIQKITRAMEMVAAARLRRAEQRIEHLRPYASAIRRMTRQAAEAAENMPSLPILQQHERRSGSGCMLVTGDRGLAGAFNSQILRAGLRAASGARGRGPHAGAYYASGRRGVSSLTFRESRRSPAATSDSPTGPAYANAREIAEDLMSALHRRRPRPRRDLLQRLRLAAHPGGAPRDAAAAPAGEHHRGRPTDDERRGTRSFTRWSSTSRSRRRSCTA